MNKSTWVKCIAILKSVYGVIDDSKENIYLSILGHIPDELFESGVTSLVTNYEYDKFPKPATILKFCGMDEKTMAQKAMTVLKKATIKVGQYRSVDLDDRVLHAVVERFGGWETICCWEEKDFGFREKNMMEAYVSIKNSGILGPEYLHGISEKQNNFNGYTKKIPPPRRLINKGGLIEFVESKKAYGIEYKEPKKIEDKGKKSNVESIKDLMEGML